MLRWVATTGGDGLASFADSVTAGRLEGFAATWFFGVEVRATGAWTVLAGTAAEFTFAMLSGFASDSSACSEPNQNSRSLIRTTARATIRRDSAISSRRFCFFARLACGLAISVRLAISVLGFICSIVFLSIRLRCLAK